MCQNILANAKTISANNYVINIIMFKAKSTGPCAIPECNNKNASRFRKMTDLAIEKIKNKHPEGDYDFIKKDSELCHEHYMKIVESDAYEKYKNKSSQAKIVNLSGGSGYSKDELDWSRIKINAVDDNVILSKDVFRNIVNHINNLELQINENSYYINKYGDYSDVNNEISNGNIFSFFVA